MLRCSDPQALRAAFFRLLQERAFTLQGRAAMLPDSRFREGGAVHSYKVQDLSPARVVFNALVDHYMLLPILVVVNTLSTHPALFTMNSTLSFMFLGTICDSRWCACQILNISSANACPTVSISWKSSSIVLNCSRPTTILLACDHSPVCGDHFPERDSASVFCSSDITFKMPSLVFLTMSGVI